MTTRASTSRRSPAATRAHPRGLGGAVGLEVGSGTSSGQRYTGQGARFQIQRCRSALAPQTAFLGGAGEGDGTFHRHHANWSAKDGRRISILAFAAIGAIGFEPIGPFFITIDRPNMP